MGTPRTGLSRPEVKASIVRLLRIDGPCTKKELRAKIRTSVPTLRRALEELEDAQGISRNTSNHQWTLLVSEFALPLEAPSTEDVNAVLLAEALAAPFADQSLRRRLRRLSEQLDEHRRSRCHDGPAQATQPPVIRDALVTTSSSQTDLCPDLVRKLLAAVRTETLLIRYASPWTASETRRTIEPWQLRLHDGSLYVRAWDRSAGEPRTFRGAHIITASRIPIATPRAPIPPQEHIWAGGDPAFGIDHDRPDTARIRIRGGVARWVAATRWSADQHDTWLVPDQLLERVASYQSRREMCRKVLSVLDGVEHIEPPALRALVAEAVTAHQDHLASSTA